MPETPRARAGRLRRRAPIVSAGLFAGNLLELGQELGRLERAGAAMVHLDIADGRFCPLFMGGPDLVGAVSTPLVKDLHLMVADPLSVLPRFVAAGADLITTHVEATSHPHRVLRALGEAVGPSGGPPMRGVALNPGTPVAAIEPLLDELELVLLLAIDPGWPDAPNEAAVAERLRAVRAMVEEADRDDVLIAVDGAITPQRARTFATAGADVVVAGTAVFAGTDPAAAIADLVLSGDAR